MNKVSSKLLFLILALSIASMSAHGFVEHETEICKVCLLKVNQRDDLDTNSPDDGDGVLPEFVFIWLTPPHSPEITGETKKLHSYTYNKNLPIRGPPAIS